MKRWTNEEIELLRNYVEEGLYYKDIGQKLGRTTLSVQRKCNNLKISNNIRRNIHHTNESYDLKLKERCPTMIRIGNYVDIETSILHKCLLCEKEYNCAPRDKFAGYKCKFCSTQDNRGGVPHNKPAICYLIYLPSIDLYKLGITSKTIVERMSDNRISKEKYEVILSIECTTGIEAMQMEKYWKENIKDYLVNTGILRDGNTETFRYYE